MLSDLFMVVAGLFAFVLRQSVEGLGYVVVGGVMAVIIRIACIIPLLFGAVRSWKRGYYVLALPLFLIELYFLYNRLTVFSVRPLSIAEALGNLGLLWLGILFLIPFRYWRQGRRQADADQVAAARAIPAWGRRKGDML